MKMMLHVLGLLKAKVTLISPVSNVYISFYFHKIYLEIVKWCDIEIDIHGEKNILNLSVISILVTFILQSVLFVSIYMSPR